MTHRFTPHDRAKLDLPYEDESMQRFPDSPFYERKRSITPYLIALIVALFVAFLFIVPIASKAMTEAAIVQVGL